MPILYSTSIEAIEPGDLQGFFEGWPNPPSPKTHLAILKGSYRTVLSTDSATGRVVGFINAIGDGVLAAFIPLLEVLPEYRGQGIGRELVQRMLRELGGLYMVDLICDEDLRPFYEKLGMTPARAMIIRNFARQAGPG